MQGAEARRLEALRILEALNRPFQERFGLVTALAADLFKTPLALVSLIEVDGSSPLSTPAVAASSPSQTWTFSAEALLMGPNALLVVEDATEDQRFAADPLVTGAANIRFYAGAVLTTRDGRTLGTLCVIDTRPRRRLRPAKLDRLKMLARIVVDELELARAHRLASEKQRLLELTESVSGVGHWRIEVGAGDVVWSDMVYTIHGVSREDFEPDLQNSLALYHPDDRAKVAACVREAVATKGSFEAQLRINRPDGEIRDVISRGVCELDEDGAATAVFGVFQDITDQTHTLNAVKRSERRYKLLADNMSDVVTRIRLDGGSGYISPTIERLLGYRPEEMTGRPAHAFVHEDDQSLILAIFGQMALGQEQKTLQHRAVHKDGRTIWVETSFRLVRDERDQPVEIVAVIRDATDRKALEDATIAARDEAREQAQRAGTAERMAGLGHWRLEVATRSVTWSEQMYQIYGLDPALPLDLDALLAMTHPDDQAESSQRLHRALTTGQPTMEAVFRLIRADGQLRDITGNMLVQKDADGQVIAVVGTMSDVTEQQHAQAALAQSEARYRLLAENASDLIMHSDVKGQVTYVSPSILPTTGYAPEALVGTNILDWIAPEDVPGVQAAVAKQFKSRGAEPPIAVEYRVRHKDGRELWLEARPTLAFDPETGAITGITDVVRDISARRVLEAELRAARAEAEAAAAVKSEFLANMSHELRTPLTAVLGFSRLAEEQPELSNTTRGYLKRACNAGQALLLTVNDILDFSKLEAGQVEIAPRPMSPAKLAAETLDLFATQAAEKGIELHLGGLETLPRTVRADPDRMRQILLNLIGNAVKFTMVGSVRVDAIFEPLGGFLSFAVTDTGPGVPEDRADQLFQRFSQVDASSTRKHGGTGLGLAICKGLAEAMGGDIGAQSKVGEGSCFWFTIPAPELDVAAPIAAPPQDQIMLPAGCRVLVADDNRVNRDLVRAMLSPFDVELTEVVDGLGAVAAANAAPFDVILMDLRMPGLDGAGAARCIRTEDGPNATIPILAFSADVDQAQATGLFDGMVGKPLTGANLLTAIAKAMAWPEAPLDDAA
jgi:PAS domain S-box-containing protein